MLPYDRILIAIKRLSEVRRQELHDYERPLAMLALQQAEMHRDRKKRKAPYKLEDFYVYMDIAQQNLPSHRYASAFKRLLSMGKCPSWALFVYKDLTSVSDGGKEPDEIALIHSECIILAPDFNDGECRGMLLALESASNQILEFRSTSGYVVTLKVPKIQSKVIADEEACLQVYQ